VKQDHHAEFLRHGSDSAVALIRGTSPQRVVLGDATPGEYLSALAANCGPGRYLLECGGCDLAELQVQPDGSAVLKEWLDESDDAGTRYVERDAPRFTTLPASCRPAQLPTETTAWA
jgi:hypothetical protein